MPLYDKDFGAKLKEMQLAIGFRFPASDFSNGFLAKLLDTADATISRKKKGGRLVTEGDWSTLTSYFDLARYGFEAAQFGADLEEFKQIMREVERKAQRAAKPNKAREDLFELASDPAIAGRLWISLARGRMRAGGIGGEPNGELVPSFLEGERVEVRVSIPKDGHLILLNDDRDTLTCLMPSHYAPRLSVTAGDVTVPTSIEFPYFPVAGPANNYRLYAVWFAKQPALALATGDFRGSPPRDIDSTEFVQLVEYAKQTRDQGGYIMVAYADYKVK